MGNERDGHLQRKPLSQNGWEWYYKYKSSDNYFILSSEFSNLLAVTLQTMFFDVIFTCLLTSETFLKAIKAVRGKRSVMQVIYELWNEINEGTVYFWNSSVTSVQTTGWHLAANTPRSNLSMHFIRLGDRHHQSIARKSNRFCCERIPRNPV